MVAKFFAACQQTSIFRFPKPCGMSTVVVFQIDSVVLLRISKGNQSEIDQ
jgi:hypothetical protein